MRRFLITLLIGGVIGLGIGLYLAWVQFPVQTVNSPIHDLSANDKDRYTVMVAQSYLTDGDTAAAIKRLSVLGVPNVPAYVRDVTERFISSSGTGSEVDIRPLVALSQALGYFTAPMQAFAGPTVTPAASR